jgi:hypothetical protein
MLKLLTFPGEDEDGNIFVQAIDPVEGLTKTASAELAPKVRDFIGDIQPNEGSLYILVNALGAGEYYGSNINGDYFEEKELNPTDPNVSSGHKTFLSAGIYRHHKNKDIERSMGKIVCACYNPVMHRVELVIRMDKARAEQEGHGDVIRSLDEGGRPAVSMGCKVKYDVCSICGHRSKTRADYCHHAKTMMGKVFPDGRKVFVYNPNPRFFDLSFVVIGADRTSYAMAKVASAHGTPSSALQAEVAQIRDGDHVQVLKEKLASKNKVSQILKRLPAMSAKILPHLSRAEPELPKSILSLMGKLPLEKALTTSSAAGIVLRPKEYQRVVLTRMGHSGLADMLESAKRIFPPTNTIDRSVSIGNRGDFAHTLKSALLPHIESRSAFGPPLIKRITIIINRGPSMQPEHGNPRGIILKTAGIDLFQYDPLLKKISASYNGYREQLLEKIGSVVANITSNDIDLLSVINGSGLEDAFMDTTMTKTAKLPLALIGVLPMAYLYGASVRENQRAGLSTGPLDNFIEKHPILATSVFAGLTRLGMHLKGTGFFDRLLRKVAT